MAQALHGVIAEFDRPETLSRALEAARRAGYTHLEAFSPFPLRNVADALGARASAIPWIAAIAGFIGAGIQYGSQYWLNAVDYPLNVGGRPRSWPGLHPCDSHRRHSVGGCRNPHRAPFHSQPPAAPSSCLRCPASSGPLRIASSS